jgi:GTP-binding protein LepA
MDSFVSLLGLPPGKMAADLYRFQCGFGAGIPSCAEEIMAYDQKYIRNFCIIAHIDHGKSTLADRMMELTDTVALRDMEDQLLDTMEIERERGITIKATAVRMFYTHTDGQTYMFNLIDTPGHVDFTYEVSRALAACEGAVLVVDATQGIEAQTLANVYLALDNNLEIVPVINKIDLPSAQPDFVVKEIEDVIGLPAEDAPRISAKSGQNVEQVLGQIVELIPPPQGDAEAPLQALIFDSIYDNYKGALSYVRVKNGRVKPGMRIRSMATGREFDVTEVGVFTPALRPTDSLGAGEVGYVAASIKSVAETKVGDTITDASNPAKEALPGYKQVQPMVFCGIYPADGADYENLKDALDKLVLNDASLSYEPETSLALGFGFRCGFLGLLHMEIIQERLEREFDLDLVTTAPSVIYKVTKLDGTKLSIDNPSNLPPPAEIAYMEEPMVEAHIMTPSDYVGTIMELCQEKRGVFIDMTYMEETRVNIKYELPLNEIIYDFFDQLKSRSRGYASFDYELKEYRRSDLVKLDFLLNGDVCDALSTIVHKDRAYAKGRAVAEKLQEVIPRQQFEVPIQAAIGSKIIARETVRALRKDVLAKCYGGDITRKKKLLEKQKEGKKRMRQVGTVSVPSEAFMSVLRIN